MAAAQPKTDEEISSCDVRLVLEYLVDQYFGTSGAYEVFCGLFGNGQRRVDALNEVDSDVHLCRSRPPLPKTGFTILREPIVEESNVRPRKDIDESLGERIRRLRSAKGYTEAELGKAIGTSHRMIAYYEVQGGNPPADVTVKLAQALGVAPTSCLAWRLRARAVGRRPNLTICGCSASSSRSSSLSRGTAVRVVQLIDALAEREALKKARA